MSFDKLRIYQNTIIGALGGLLGWCLITLLLRFETTNTALLFAKDAGLGALVGGSIGLAVGVAEQRIGGLAWSKLPRVFLSGAAGVAAGLIGLMIGEGIFLAAGGGVWPRALGWALFGLLLGASQWPITRMPSKGLYGAVGGLLGGMIGGSTYERLTIVLRNAGIGRDLALTVGSAIGLIILGACIALFIGLVEDILRRAWLRFIYGPLEGKTYSLDSRRATLTIGRSDGCDVMIRHDPELQPVHAAIETRSSNFWLVAREGIVMLRRTQVAEPVHEHLLVNGDTVQLGKSRFIFQTGEE